jgi:hypothetical protein
MIKLMIEIKKMLHLDQQHVTGSPTTSRETPGVASNSAMSKNSNRDTASTVPRTPTTKKRTNPTSDVESEDFSEVDTSPTITNKSNRKAKRKENRGRIAGGDLMGSLPHQNLDASIHARFHTPSPFFSSPSSRLTRVPFPSQGSPYGFPHVVYTDSPVWEGSTRFVDRLADAMDAHNLSKSGNELNANLPSTKSGKSKGKSKQISYALAAKYALGKPTFNSDEGFGPAYQSKNKNTLIYCIDSITEVPDNQVVSSVNLQIGKALHGLHMKYTKAKRSHLELVFVSEEAVDNWVGQPITIAGRNFKGFRPSNSSRTFLSVSLSGTPIGDRLEVSADIQSTFSKYGKITSIRPKLWEGTSLCSDKWSISFETTSLADPAELTSKLPRTVKIGEHKIFVTWRAAPPYCNFCRKTGHKKSDCLDLKRATLNEESSLQATSATVTQPILSESSTQNQTTRLASDIEDSSPMTDSSTQAVTATSQPSSSSNQEPPPEPSEQQDSSNSPPFTLVENSRKKKKEEKKKLMSSNPSQQTKVHNTRSRVSSSSK